MILHEIRCPNPDSCYPLSKQAEERGDGRRKGIIKDLFRRPEKLLEAIDVVTDFTIWQTIEAAHASKAITAIFPLHKGADGFMSPKQFEKFNWPSLTGEGILPQAH